ncbi:MAG: NADH-quinone oxidoreductase subunit L [Chitinophagales bacterium]|nr:NADH-quinone oxidoreductase subunit L [Chitinophagales bacterium]
MNTILALLILAPVVGFLINGLYGHKLSKNLSAVIGSTAILVSFICTMLLYKTVPETGSRIQFFNILSLEAFNLDAAFLIDHLSLMMMSIITGIGFLIHLYSAGYMHHDKGMSKFFAYLNLFIFSMLLLVAGSSYTLMFFGWEGVGLCSYLLIGFWFTNGEYANAAKKAFVMNRIGDLGFLMGMFLFLQNFGSLDYSVLKEGQLHISSGMATAITLLLFVGAMGKSAQLPLYTWLPDAMAGPTPVSALIHAATMVTAGIYMIVRSNALFVMSPFTMHFIATIGLATALFAGTIALFQNDIKKVLAYSTVSQLGFMFLGLGVGAFTSGMFHLMTHAFFKALLFLGAGSVIHAMSGEQNIAKMGGLRKQIPITFWTFTIGVFAIIGIPFTSGFVSKDEILNATYAFSPMYFYLAAIGAGLTIFYMLRLWYLTFFGNFRGTKEQQDHMHESPLNMTLPLMVLAVLSIVGGFIQLPELFHGHPYLNEYLSPVVKNLVAEHGTEGHEGFEWALFGGTIVVLIAMFAWTSNLFGKKESVSEKYSGFAGVLENKYYVDEIYNFLVVKPIEHISVLLSKIVDNKIVDGMVFITGKFVTWSGTTLRYIQNGQTGFYFLMMSIAIVVMLAYNLLFKL